MHFKIGAPVYGSDGKHLGEVGRVVIDPRTEDLTDLFVRDSDDDAFGAVVPVDRVAHSDDSSVRLSIDATQFGDLPRAPATALVPLESVERGPLVGWEGWPYGRDQILVPAETLYNVEVRPFAPQIVQEGGLLPGGLPDIAGDTEVVCRDGVVGHVVEVLANPVTGHLQGLVVAHGHPNQPPRLVPISAIAHIAPNAIRLNVDRAQFECFPSHVEERAS